MSYYISILRKEGLSVRYLASMAMHTSHLEAIADTQSFTSSYPLFRVQQRITYPPHLLVLVFSCLLLL